MSRPPLPPIPTPPPVAGPDQPTSLSGYGSVPPPPALLPPPPMGSPPPRAASAPPPGGAPASIVSRLWAWIRRYLLPGSIGEWLSAKALLVALPVLVAVGKYGVIPTVASQAVEIYSEAYGVEMTVEDWSADVLDLSATAHNVAIRADQPHWDKKEVLVAEEMVVDLSLLSRLRRGSWVSEVRVQEPRLFLQRLVSGNWNWGDVASPTLVAAAVEERVLSAPGDPRLVTASTRGEAGRGSDFDIGRMRIEDLRLEWVENLPGRADSGLIHREQATLYLDDVSMTIDDLRGLIDERRAPSRITLEARTGDGKISLSGRSNLFQWAAAAAERDPASPPRPIWAPALDGQLVLENVGAGAFARLVPESPLLPERGSMSGQIQLAVSQHTVTCEAELDLRDVTFAVNRASPLVGSNLAALERSAKGFQSSGHVRFDCGGELESEHYRPFQAFQTAMTRRAVDQGPRPMRVVAEADRVRYAEDTVDPELRSDVIRLARAAPRGSLPWLEAPAILGGRPGEGPIRNAPDLGGLPDLRRRWGF